MMPSAMALRSALAERVGDDALQREQRRQDQERAEHVRILEGAARAAVQRQEIVAAGHQVEIAGDAASEAMTAPTTRPRRNRSSRASVSSDDHHAQRTRP